MVNRKCIMCDESSISYYHGHQISGSEMYPLLMNPTKESYASNRNQGWCVLCNLVNKIRGRYNRPNRLDSVEQQYDTISQNSFENEKTTYNQIDMNNTIQRQYYLKPRDSIDVGSYLNNQQNIASSGNLTATAKDYWGNSNENTDGDIPAIVMVLMIVLACLVTLAICLAVFGVVSYRRKRSNGRGANQVNTVRQHRPSSAESRSPRRMTHNVVARRNESEIFANILLLDENQQRSYDTSPEVPPAYEDIVALDEKDLPSYEEFLEQNKNTPTST